MKYIFVVFIIAQLHGAFSASVPVQDQRALLDLWDSISHLAIPAALLIDNAIGTINNIQSSISNAVSNALYQVTSFIGDKIPALGKRDAETDAPLELFNELRSFRFAFQQNIVELIPSLFGDNYVAKFKQAIAKLITFLQTHLEKLNTLIHNIIPTIENTVATQAIASVQNVIQVVQEAIQKVHALFLS